jgi:pimeloyl-ACP methyl ester carboxylesterase
MNTESKNTPIVMVHGFAAGIAFWVMNLEELSKDRPLYAIDLPGFGRSARPKFSKEAEEIEQQYVDSIERWREMMGIDKMVLLGHSFGGYLSSAYAMRHPEKVEHLILGEKRRLEGKSIAKRKENARNECGRVFSIFAGFQVAFKQYLYSEQSI